MGRRPNDTVATSSSPQDERSDGPEEDAGYWNVPPLSLTDQGTDDHADSTARIDTKRRRRMQNVAILYDSYNLAEKCACTVPWKRLILKIQQEHLSCCPLCFNPIAYIQDGYVKHQHQQHASQKETNNNPRSTVVFKYGKIVYELTIPSSKDDEILHDDDDDDNDKADNSDNKEGLSLWWLVFGWWWAKRKNRQQQKRQSMLNDPEFLSTAQGRIMQALNLSAIKILCKGKIVYPPPHAAASVSKEEAPNTAASDPDVASTASLPMSLEREISEKIVQLSRSTTSRATTPSSSSSSKVPLLVMGTIVGDEVLSTEQLRHKQQQQKQQQSSSLDWSYWIGIAIHTTQNVVIGLFSGIRYLLQAIHTNLIQPLLITNRRQS